MFRGPPDGWLVLAVTILLGSLVLKVVFEALPPPEE